LFILRHPESKRKVLGQSEEVAMRIELMAGTDNVVRFPVERRGRPTMELLREIAPDVREVMQLVESFDLPHPGFELRQRADAEMADHVMNHVRPEPGAERRAALAGLLAPRIGRAVEACRAAHDAAVAATEAQQRVVAAQSEGGYWLTPMKERADALTTAAAQCLVRAHALAEEAEGVARAVGMEVRGETWVPFNLPAEAEALFFGDRRSA
jgi:hypothetical protein